MVSHRFRQGGEIYSETADFARRALAERVYYRTAAVLNGIPQRQRSPALWWIGAAVSDAGGLARGLA